MAKLIIERKQILVIVVAGLLILLLVFGFGYFFGRFEQGERNRRVLDVVPEVNCGRNKIQPTSFQINSNIQKPSFKQ